MKPLATFAAAALLGLAGTTLSMAQTAGGSGGSTPGAASTGTQSTPPSGAYPGTGSSPGTSAGIPQSTNKTVNGQIKPGEPANGTVPTNTGVTAPDAGTENGNYTGPNTGGVRTPPTNGATVTHAAP